MSTDAKRNYANEAAARSDRVCIECKREIYGQGLQALITTTNNVERHAND